MATRESVGRALRDSGIPRAQVFIATKFNPARNDAAAEVERSLQRLGADYVDLYLVHWPQGGATRAWPGIERARVLSYARSIGVSNFGARELDTLLAAATVSPVVDQVQFNPFEYRRGLLDATLQRAIVAEAYSPLGPPPLEPDGAANRSIHRPHLGAGPAALESTAWPHGHS